MYAKCKNVPELGMKQDFRAVRVSPFCNWLYVDCWKIALTQHPSHSTPHARPPQARTQPACPPYPPNSASSGTALCINTPPPSWLALPPCLALAEGGSSGAARAGCQCHAVEECQGIAPQAPGVWRHSPGMRHAFCQPRIGWLMGEVMHGFAGTETPVSFAEYIAFPAVAEHHRRHTTLVPSLAIVLAQGKGLQLWRSWCTTCASF